MPCGGSPSIFSRINGVDSLRTIFSHLAPSCFHLNGGVGTSHEIDSAQVRGPSLRQWLLFCTRVFFIVCSLSMSRTSKRITGARALLLHVQYKHTTRSRELTLLLCAFMQTQQDHETSHGYYGCTYIQGTANLVRTGRCKTSEKNYDIDDPVRKSLFSQILLSVRWRMLL